MTDRLADRIARELAQAIAAGEFDGSGRMPTERELAARFGVARNTVRRAMQALTDDGRISRQVGRGTFLADGAELAAPGLASAQLVLTDISPRDLIEARLLIEPQAAAAAAANATEADILRLTRAQDASLATDIMEEFERQDAEIHRLLFAMTRNSVMAQIDNTLCGMRANSEWLAAKRRAYSQELKARYVKQHADIIEAVRLRSPRAAREAMTLHLEEVRRALLEG